MISSFQYRVKERELQALVSSYLERSGLTFIGFESFDIIPEAKFKPDFILINSPSIGYQLLYSHFNILKEALINYKQSKLLLLKMLPSATIEVKTQFRREHIGQLLQYNYYFGLTFVASTSSYNNLLKHIKVTIDEINIGIITVDPENNSVYIEKFPMVNEKFKQASITSYVFRNFIDYYIVRLLPDIESILDRPVDDFLKCLNSCRQSGIIINGERLVSYSCLKNCNSELFSNQVLILMQYLNILVPRAEDPNAKDKYFNYSYTKLGKIKKRSLSYLISRDLPGRNTLINMFIIYGFNYIELSQIYYNIIFRINKDYLGMWNISYVQNLDELADSIKEGIKVYNKVKNL